MRPIARTLTAEGRLAAAVAHDPPAFAVIRKIGAQPAILIDEPFPLRVIADAPRRAVGTEKGVPRPTLVTLHHQGCVRRGGLQRVGPAGSGGGRAQPRSTLTLAGSRTCGKDQGGCREQAQFHIHPPCEELEYSINV
jgi:hypothetical protein